jgi:hypothetical protein
LNSDVHLALKLKVQGLQDRVRPLQPPHRRATEAAVLQHGAPFEAGMHPDSKANIDAVCRDWAEDTGEPFVVLVARHGVIVTHAAFGNDSVGEPNDRSYKRITTALDRYQKLTATFRHNWYSKKERAITLQLMTGIVAQAEVVTQRGRRAANAPPESHVQWTENFATRLREGNVLPINLRLLFGWSRPGAKQLHRQLNKTWRDGQKPTLYERDLRELACGYLGMTNSQSLKRNFHQVVIEMEHKGYLTPMAFEDRYIRIGAGIWPLARIAASSKVRAWGVQE